MFIRAGRAASVFFGCKWMMWGFHVLVVIGSVLLVICGELSVVVLEVSLCGWIVYIATPQPVGFLRFCRSNCSKSCVKTLASGKGNIVRSIYIHDIIFSFCRDLRCGIKQTSFAALKRFFQSGFGLEMTQGTISTFPKKGGGPKGLSEAEQLRKQLADYVLKAMALDACQLGVFV